MAEFKAGDVVQIKSGGPRMTIEKIATFESEREERARCIWFDGKTHHSEIFGLHTLKPADPTAIE